MQHWMSITDRSPLRSAMSNDGNRTSDEGLQRVVAKNGGLRIRILQVKPTEGTAICESAGSVWAPRRSSSLRRKAKCQFTGMGMANLRRAVAVPISTAGSASHRHPFQLSRLSAPTLLPGEDQLTQLLNINFLSWPHYLTIVVDQLDTSHIHLKRCCGKMLSFP